jgi:hypothetical protein
MAPGGWFAEGTSFDLRRMLLQRQKCRGVLPDVFLQPFAEKWILPPHAGEGARRADGEALREADPASALKH